MAKINSFSTVINDDALLSIMSGGGAVPKISNEAKEKNNEYNEEKQVEASCIVQEKPESKNKKEVYTEKYLYRNIIGKSRGNVGISEDTLKKTETILSRVFFDKGIAVGAFIDNILVAHFNKHKKDYDAWLKEVSAEIF